MYFFVKLDNQALAATIEQGLQKALADGSFLSLFGQFFQQHLKQMALERRTVIELTNPFLPPLTPLDNAALWHKIDNR